jgi:hypothetical protein
MLVRLFFCLFIVSLFSVLYSEEQWQREEKEILLVAERENLPIIAVFVGGQWCPWSQKLKEDVLNNPLFIDRIGKDVILWEIFLEKEPQDHAMRQKYGVKECPQILLLDPRGKEFARIDYAPLSASGYADELLGMIESFQDICIALDAKHRAFDEELWQGLYLKAKKLSIPCYKQVILECSLKKERGNFFHLEKFASMLQKYKMKSPQILKMKRELLGRDPENKMGTHFKIAVLELQKMALRLKPKDSPEKVLKPLLEYVRLFGKKDPENLWRVEAMIAEFLFAKNFVGLALEHAQLAYAAASELDKEQIAEMIAFMKRST